jgi:hypothetical protein
MNNILKTFAILALIVFPTSAALAAATYTVAVGSQSISGLTLSLSGTGSAGDNYAGNLVQYDVYVDWGDGATTVSTDTFTDPAGSPKFFSGTWSNSHPYSASGTYSVVVKLCHSSCTGAESASADASVTIIVVIPPSTQGGLLVKKTLVNDNGGTTPITSFSFQINGGTATAFEADGQNDFTLTAGPYSVTEVGVPIASYATTYSVGCTAGVSVGATTTCTIINDDIAPTIKVFKTVTNDNGGTAVPTDFSFLLDALTALVHNVATATTAGLHTLSEALFGGYSASVWGGDCAANGTITLVPGQNATCTIENDDNVPSLTLNKVVVGGTELESAWTLTATGNQVSPFILSGPGASGSADVASDSTFKAGTYTLSESGPGGYTASGWSCTGTGTQVGNTIALDLGESATCLVTNTYVVPGSIVIVKNTVGGDGTFDFSSEELGDFSIETSGGSGSETFSGLAPGSYSVSEEGTPADWDFSGVACESSIDDSETSSALELDEGEAITCTFTNTKRGSIKVFKDVVDPDGGAISTAYPFTVYLDDTNPQTLAEGGPATYSNLVAGLYTLSEALDGDYDISDPVPVTLAAGGNLEVTLTNHQKKATITISKDVVDSDSEDIEDDTVFQVTVDGVTKDVSEGTPAVFAVNPGTYSVSENDNPNYTEGTVDPITVGTNGFASATITNTKEEIVVPPTPESVPQCRDGIDNEGDGLADESDPGCHQGDQIGNPFDSNDNDEHNAGGGGGGSPVLGGGIINNNGGAVLGASTVGQVLGESCGLYMDKYLRRGSAKNNKEQTEKLQELLVKQGFGTFTPTGFFGPLTEAAVHAFQAKYGDQILKPWNLTASTGLVYISTLRWINMLECPELALQLPPLVPWSQNPSAQ